MLKCAPKKMLIFQRYQDFEKWREGKFCKDYNLCKIVNLGLNFKVPKTDGKHFHNQFRDLFFFSKRGSKIKPQYSKNTKILKSGVRGNFAKAIAFTKLSI